jgi:uncharacterized protein (TIGR02217 family)
VATYSWFDSWPPPVFPALPGQGWSVKETPTNSTLIAAHASGREVRSALWVNPLRQFEFVFDGLASNAAYPGLYARSKQMLLDVYVAAQGQFGTFIYTNPSDCTAKGAALGTGDGSTTAFAARRQLIATWEPVPAVTYLDAVYLDGAPQSGWSLRPPASIVFAAPPAAGLVVTADFSFGWVCRFLTDALEFEEFMSNLHTVRSVKARQVRLPGPITLGHPIAAQLLTGIPLDLGFVSDAPPSVSDDFGAVAGDPVQQIIDLGAGV